MPPRCKTCSHPQRAKIDRSIIAGVSLRTIAQRFKGPSAWSIYRHTRHTQAMLLAGMRTRNAKLEEQLRMAVRDGLQEQLAAFERYEGLIHHPLTSEQVREIREALFGAYVRSVSYMLRLLRDGADSGGPNSRRGLIRGLGPQGPTLHRVL